MREILFRGKRADGYGWIEGDLIHDEAENNRPRINIGREYSTGTFFNAQAPRVMRETVGQFTGLTDKNGTKIFEGDIVKAIISINDYSRDRVRNEEGIYEIKYHTKHCYFYLAKEGNNLLFDGNWHYYLKEIKVIGNKWDNPELLGE
jgi:uncharacterized phage protein (TIGR01671 family)